MKKLTVTVSRISVRPGWLTSMMAVSYNDMAVTYVVTNVAQIWRLLFACPSLFHIVLQS